MTLSQDPVTVIAVASGLGLVAGVVGGLAGIGGSIIMLPGLALLLGYQDQTRIEQHTYQAAAMIVNVLVAVPATLRHKKAGAIRGDVVWNLLPPMALAIVAGVLLSNRIDGTWLSLVLALFVSGYCVSNIVKVVKGGETKEMAETPLRKNRLYPIGLLAGLVAGLLGVGGGVIIVPLLGSLSRVPLRAAIAASATVMCMTAVVGASIKVASLPSLDLAPADALVLAVAMGPTAMIGAWFGAKLTHTLPVNTVRLVVSVVLLVGAARLGGLF